MNSLPDDFQARRALLTAEIAKQRGELSEAYHHLARPIHYAEYSLRGFGFLRKNSWIFVAVPGVISIVSTLWGARKKKAVPSPQAARQSLARNEKTAAQHPVARWAGHGWRLYKLYRRVRPYFM